ncbi:MAG TPA: response regulator [Acidobacteriaceae bacterium]|jgi:DNA-binding response OmpR family regulator|nr:response regulator [Acidobacteriaceae bacterium]
MKRRILLVDDEVAVLLTLKAVLEISGFEVDTAASGREGRSKMRSQQYHMVITDMRMESDAAGAEVIAAARSASYHPAIALLTAFPLADEDWQALGADKMLVKPMHTQVLLQQIEKLLASHEAKLKIWSVPPPAAKASGKLTKPAAPRNARPSVKKTINKRVPVKPPVKKSSEKTTKRKLATKPVIKAAKR